MDKRQHTLLNICLAFLFSVWISVHPNMKGMNSGGGWGLAWFVVMYITAAWFRKYYTPDGKPIKYFAVYLALPAMIAAMQCVLGEDGISGILHTIVSNWFRYDSAPAYIMTLSLFIGFLNITINNDKLSKVVCAVSPLTFGVYLIHAHANVSPWSWAILNLPAKMDLVWFPLIQMGSVVGIFVVCIAVDALRKRALGEFENHTKVISHCNKLTVYIIDMIDIVIKRR